MRLLCSLAWPHRLLVNADEVHLQPAPNVARRELDNEIDGPLVVPVEGRLLDVVTCGQRWRVVVQRPAEDMRVERDR